MFSQSCWFLYKILTMAVYVPTKRQPYFYVLCWLTIMSSVHKVCRCFADSGLWHVG